MIIVMHADATDAQIEAVVNRIREYGLDINVSRGIERTLVGAIGDERRLDQAIRDHGWCRTGLAYRQALQDRGA